MTLPVWGQWVLGAAALITAMGVLWAKVVKPLLKFAKQADRMIPLLQKLTDTFIANPNSFGVLNEIASQFKTDSGSSLRDVVDRLEKAANENHQAAEILKVELASTKQLAERDRQEIQRLILMIDRVAEAQKVVATNLIEAQKAVDTVALDLADAHKRADAIHHTEPAGTAADAASQVSQTDEEA